MSKPVHVVLLLFLVAISVFGLGIWQTVQVKAQTICDVDCLAEKLEMLTKRVVALEKRSVGSSSAVKVTKKEAAVQLSGGVVESASEWTKIANADFWFDQSLYGNVVEVTWQGWVDNGTAQVRLYDATNNRVVDYSELAVKNDEEKAVSFFSKPLAIWRGQNLYQIQVRSQIGGRVAVSSPRLRVVTR